jgi:hypothetical protein
MMADIFKGAEVVLSWLGEGTPELDEGLSALAMLADATSGMSTDQIVSLSWKEYCPMLCQPAPTCQHEEDYQVFFRGNPTWDGMNKVSAAPYWSRVWILQAISLARDLSLFTSGTVIDLRVLLNAEKCLTALTAALVKPGFIWPTFVASSVRSFTRGQLWDWTEITRANAGRKPLSVSNNVEDAILHDYSGWVLSFYARGLRATDPKDHIYGLRALSDVPIPVDYSLETPVGQMYSEYTAGLLAFLINHRHPNIEPHELFFLQWAGCGLYENSLGLAYWAPNFPEESVKVLVGCSVEANADQCIFPEECVEAAVQGTTLVVSGVKIDRTADINEALALSGWYNGTTLAFIKTFVSSQTRYSKPLQEIVKMIRLHHQTAQLPATATFAVHFPSSWYHLTPHILKDISLILV